MAHVSLHGILYIALTILFTVVGQLLVKLGMRQVGVSPADAGGLLPYLVRAFSNLLVVGGLGSGLVAAACWMLALSRVKLSLAYPFMGLAIVLVLALAPLLLGERIPWTRWAGVTLVVLGLWLAARGQ